MTRNLLLVDAGIAALLAVLVLILAPGLAVVAIIAIVVVVGARSVSRSGRGEARVLLYDRGLAARRTAGR